MNLLLAQRPASLSQRLACRVLAFPRSSVQREQRRQTFCGPPRPPVTSRRYCRQPRQLSEWERRQALQVLHSETFQDQPPAKVYHTLLDQGRYLCSISTFYRLLRRHGQAGERRWQRPPQSHAVPRLCARKPNEVWTWDITKLATQQRGVYLSLYVILDLFSRYILAWLLSRKENSALAQQLVWEAWSRYGIHPRQLTLHQDRGAPMTAHAYLDLLGELGIQASHSRPRVSNDNPHSESQFKTLKYQPDYPRRFAHYNQARQWCTDYVDWLTTTIAIVHWPDTPQYKSLPGNTGHWPGPDKLPWTCSTTNIRSALSANHPELLRRRRLSISILFWMSRA